MVFIYIKSYRDCHKINLIIDSTRALHIYIRGKKKKGQGREREEENLFQ